jgi:predicted protein tyrosine phosphatase
MQTKSATIHVCPLSAVPTLSRAIGATHLLTLLREIEQIETPPHIHPERHLRVEVNDICEPQDGMIHPVSPHIEAVLRFARGWDRRAPMLIHCWAGISRSTAGAFISLCALNPDAKEKHIAEAIRAASPTAYPNRLMVRLADEALGREGRMIAAVESIGRGIPAMEAEPFHVPLEFGSR